MEGKKYTGKIAAVSPKNKANGSIGFLLDGDTTWFNINASEDALETILKVTIVKGNKIEFLMGNTGIENLKVLEKAPEKETKKWEDDMVTFEDLLTKAHALKGIFSIKTEMLMVDLEKKYALFKAVVIVDGGTLVERIFEGHGDATIDNVTGEFIKPHFIRMAETRAICRALRWYTNNGCAEEEK